jgi:UDP:flavonoid glycosyltransferase YjiC (YdhE family)
MKILVVSSPLTGHLSPMLPVISAFLDSGDEVLVASGAATARLVERAGATFQRAGNDSDAWFARLGQRTRGNPGDGIAPERINHYFVPRLFAEIGTGDMIDDALRAGRDFGPDLVLFESLAFAGPLVAELLGVPGVQHLFGPILAHEIFELANDAVSPIWRSFGRDVPGYAGVYRDLTVEICPPSLEARKVPAGDVVSLRPAPLPDRPTTRGPRPVVYVTLGTFFNGNTQVFRTILDGLADQPVDVVVTVGGDRDPAELEPTPGNATIKRFIAQAELLPTCSVIVHHGGAGTTFGALAHGVPQVIVPQGADNYDNAAMCERADLALVLGPDEFTAKAVGDSVSALLGEPRFLGAARRTADEIATMTDPVDVADRMRAYRR